MKTSALLRYSAITALLLLLTVLFSRPAVAADAVVGTGAPGSCTETSFDVALNTVKLAGGTITFDCGGPATIIFTGRKYIGPQHVVIDGGEQITLSGGSITTLFEVLSGSLFLRNITLTNGYSPSHGGAILAANGAKLIVVNSTIQNSRTEDGYAGGAILSYDTTGDMPAVEIEDSIIQFNESGYGAINTVGLLIVRNSVIQGNTGHVVGGGFSVGGTTMIYDSQILDNEVTDVGVGGGILVTASGNVTVRGGEIRGNKARFGGGIYNAGTVVLIDTSVTQNRATYRTGGGLHTITGSAYVIGSTFADNAALSGGAAVANDRGTLSLQNSTLSNNDIVSATPGFGGGAVYSYEGATSIAYSTLVDNVGTAAEALYFDAGSTGAGSLDISNTIMVSRGGDNCSGSTADSINYSLLDDQTCLFSSGANNIYAYAFIGDLADNGGPTLTHMISSASPAIDAGQCDPLISLDQRGIARPQGPACDIGAVERRPDEGDGQQLLLLPLLLK